MMSLRKFAAYSVITALVLAAPLTMEANAEKKEQAPKEKPGIEQIKEEVPGTTEKVNVEEGKNKAWKEAKDQLIIEKDQVEAEKDKIEAQVVDLEKQLEEAKKGENAALIAELTAKLKEAKVQFITLKDQMKEIKLEMKEVVKNKYTLEELEALKKLAEEMKKENPEIQVIPVENILSRTMNMKFDTPPVIKHNRTLIPVRAISEGFGATVGWNQQEQKVTITKDNIVIVFQLKDGKVFVNGVEKAIDVPAEAMNNRTIVPLRFIVENLGLEINYDAETGTIEIKDGQEQVTEAPAVVEAEKPEETKTDTTEVVVVTPLQDPVVVVTPAAGEGDTNKGE